ncbi:hypothetical protein Tco_0116628 [Tanacetum coccineum]
MPLSKKKEKVDVTRGKGIELLSQVALDEDAQFEEVRRKSMRDFHKTHPSGSCAVSKTAPSAAKIKPSVTNEGTYGNDEDDSNNDQDSSSEDSDQENDSDNDKTQSDNDNESNSEHETNENESGSESDQEENEEDEDDEEEEEDEFVKTLSNDSDDEDEIKITNKVEGDEDKEMDYTTSQLYDDVDLRLNEPVDTDKGFVQKEGTVTNVQQGNENPEILQVIEDAHVTLSTVPQKTKVPVTSSSHSSDLAAKFLIFLDIPHTDAEIVSPMDVHVHHEVPSKQTPTLLTVPVSVITDSSRIIIPQSLPSFTPPPQQSTSTPPPTIEATNPQSALPNFASVFQFNNKVTALENKVAELKKENLLNTQVTALVDEHLDSRLGATRDEFMRYLSASITARISEQVKIQLPQILPKEMSNFAPLIIKSMVTYEAEKIKIKMKTFLLDQTEEFEVADLDMPQDQEGNLGNDDDEPMKENVSKSDWFIKPTQPQEPTDPD